MNVLSPIKATSTVNGDVYEYTSENNSFSIFKNGELVNRIRANGNVEIKRCSPFIGCNAIGVAVTAAKAGTAITAGAVAEGALSGAATVGATAAELP